MYERTSPNRTTLTLLLLLLISLCIPSCDGWFWNSDTDGTSNDDSDGEKGTQPGKMPPLEPEREYPFRNIEPQGLLGIGMVLTDEETSLLAKNLKPILPFCTYLTIFVTDNTTTSLAVNEWIRENKIKGSVYDGHHYNGEYAKNEVIELHGSRTQFLLMLDPRMEFEDIDALRRFLHDKSSNLDDSRSMYYVNVKKVLRTIATPSQLKEAAAAVAAARDTVDAEAAMMEKAASAKRAKKDLANPMSALARSQTEPAQQQNNDNSQKETLGHVIDLTAPVYRKYLLPLLMRTLGNKARYSGFVYEQLEDSARGSVNPVPVVIPHFALIFHPPHVPREEKLKRLNDSIELFQLELSTVAAESFPRPSTAFFLARTLELVDRTDDALRWYSQRTQLAGHSSEKYVALFSLVRMLVDRCDGVEAFTRDEHLILKFGLNGFNLRPNRAESLYHVARGYCNEKLYASCLLFAKKAASIPHPPDDVEVNLKGQAKRWASKEGIWLGDGMGNWFLDREIYRWKSKDLLCQAAYYNEEYVLGAQSCIFVLRHLQSRKLHKRQMPRLWSNLEYYAKALKKEPEYAGIREFLDESYEWIPEEKRAEISASKQTFSRILDARGNELLI
eukprot:TRINITY_DN10856_c0_g1_i1.p1 TRINITY_DN10856_c0_g1~~TRINITY_DN10856_c0_g1_i1.p1  ORF type:complete len:616 (+),score=147.24 TRINITY_DN10856_c0_g1_i1:284-2131(+)